MSPGILDLGDGVQATNYFVLCYSALIGALQISAAHSKRVELLWLDPVSSLVFGALAILASFGWFFTTDREFLQPGLAGGEILAIFCSALFAAVISTQVVARSLAFARKIASPRSARRKGMSR